MAKEEMIKTIDGVRAIRLYDGNWYCNFTDYKVRQIRNRGYYSKEQFVDWCSENQLKPIL